MYIYGYVGDWQRSEADYTDHRHGAQEGLPALQIPAQVRSRS